MDTLGQIISKFPSNLKVVWGKARESGNLEKGDRDLHSELSPLSHVMLSFCHQWLSRAVAVCGEMEEVKEERVSQDPDPLPLPSKSSDFYKYWNLK